MGGAKGGSVEKEGRVKLVIDGEEDKIVWGTESSIGRQGKGSRPSVE
jgi:hypothetical protein